MKVLCPDCGRLFALIVELIINQIYSFDTLECDCYVAGTIACSTLNGICECKDGYQGYNCEDCTPLYLKDDFGICQG